VSSDDEQRIRETVDGWFPLADWQLERLSLLLNPGGARAQPSITCPRCGRTSYHPDDIAAGYCGACHDFTSPRSASS
jgi:hypothetical protein